MSTPFNNLLRKRFEEKNKEKIPVNPEDSETKEAVNREEKIENKISFDGQNIEVRRAAAKNPKTSPEELAVLANDEDEDVRWNVADNPNTPPKVLVSLAKDKRESVRSMVAINPNTPLKTLYVLASDEDSGVRHTVAQNENAPLDMLYGLMGDRDREVGRLASGIIRERRRS